MGFSNGFCDWYTPMVSLLGISPADEDARLAGDEGDPPLPRPYSIDTPSSDTLVSFGVERTRGMCDSVVATGGARSRPGEPAARSEPPLP